MARPTPRELIDTRDAGIARHLGYDGARCPVEDAEGLIVTGVAASFASIPSLTLQGPKGEVEVTGHNALVELIRAAEWALDPVAAAIAAAGAPARRRA